MELKTGMAALALAALAAQAGPARAAAATVTIDFDAVTRNARVNSFYNDGTDSTGLAGLNLGIEFIDFVTANSGGASSPPRYAYDATGYGVINVFNGFSAFDFAYGTMAPATVSVWSGLGGSGDLLGSVVVNGNPSVFGHAAVAFGGVGHSVTLTSLPSYAGVDDLRFASVAAPVPEADGWAMLVLGACAIGALQRRRPELFK